MGAFEQAFIRRYNLPDSTNVVDSTEGGGEVQIGDMTWDTEPITFKITAYDNHQQILEKTYDSLSDIWDDLSRAPSQKELNMVYASLGVPAKHLPLVQGRYGQNAEDCPACDLKTMVYPFICPGPEEGSK